MTTLLSPLKNGSFEQGWETLSAPRPGNQQPRHWELGYVPVGGGLYDDERTKAALIPECVHKLAGQLPPHEQIGAVGALILGGEHTYKVFGGAAFGVELSQWVRAPARSRWRLTVPVLAVFPQHGFDPWGGESGVFVQTEANQTSADWHGGWANLHQMGYRHWHEHVVEFEMPLTGLAHVRIRLKAKGGASVDYFVDGVRMEAVGAVSSPPIPAPPVTQGGVVRVTAPQGWRVVQEVGDVPAVRFEGVAW